MKIDDININYISYGKKNGMNMVLLHGWGQNIEMMKPIGNAFKNNFKITIIDLPGFGNSDEPNNILTVFDYVEYLQKLFIKLKIENPILIGHSFGGKIAIAYASKYKVKKLILFAPSFCKTKQRLTTKQKILKILKKIPILNKLENYAKSKIGSTDYKNASPIMRQILVNSINLDLKENAKKIICPTLLIWGELDEAVKVEDGKVLDSIIPDSGLIIYPNKTHYAYLEDINKTINILDNFLKEESR